MPELPEVESVVRVLQSEIPGETIATVQVPWTKWAGNLTPPQLAQRLAGRTIREVTRRGKYIRFHLDDASQLWSHLRMTGRWLVEGAAEVDPRFHSALISFVSGRHLLFADVRRFGRATWYAPGITPAEEALLGPEPLDPALTSAILLERFLARSRELKVLMLDQAFLAGLGNIYASEILFRAKVSPFAQSNWLGRPEAGRIHKAMREILTQAIAECGTTISDFRGAWNIEGNFQQFLQVYQRAGEPCRRCRTLIVRVVQGQRATFLCPYCQAAPNKASSRSGLVQSGAAPRTLARPTRKESASHG